MGDGKRRRRKENAKRRKALAALGRQVVVSLAAPTPDVRGSCNSYTAPSMELDGNAVPEAGRDAEAGGNDSGLTLGGAGGGEGGLVLPLRCRLKSPPDGDMDVNV